jgi:hypothetical protein
MLNRFSASYVYKGVLPPLEWSILPFPHFPVLLTFTSRHSGLVKTATPTSSGFHAKFFSFYGYGIIRAVLRPLLLGSTHPLRSVHANARPPLLNPHLTRPAPSSVPHLPFSRRPNPIASSISPTRKVSTTSDSHFQFSREPRRFVPILHLRRVSCYSHVFSIFTLTTFAVTRRPRRTFLGGIITSSTVVTETGV